MLFRPNPLPKRSPSANVAPVEMSRGTLTWLSQTGGSFLLTFDLGRQDVNNKNNHGMGQNCVTTTEQPQNGSTTAPGPKSCRQQVEMCGRGSLLLHFDTVDMLNNINNHVCCKAPPSSVCPSCWRQDSQSRSQSLFDVRVACLHVVLFFSCCRVRVWPEVLTDLPFLKRPCAPKINFFVLRGSCHLGSSRGLCLSAHNLELCLWRGLCHRHHDIMMAS